MTVLLKVAVVELMIKGNSYCIPENSLALNMCVCVCVYIYIYIYIYIYDDDDA